jgi:hypothetical protein
MALVAALLAGYVGASYAATRTAVGLAGPTDTEPPPVTTTPAPDPAPPPQPKPAPKPAPSPSPTPSSTPSSRPATVYHAPVTPAPRATYTPTPRATYTPAPTHVTPKAKPGRHKKLKRRHPAKPASIAPKPQGQVKHASVVRIGVVPTAAVATEGSDAVRRTLLIVGIGVAALLFLLVVTVPATGMRFTAPGRVVIDHQTDLVLAGIGTLLLTVLVFALTGFGS